MEFVNPVPLRNLAWRRGNATFEQTASLPLCAAIWRRMYLRLLYQACRRRPWREDLLSLLAQGEYRRRPANQTRDTTAPSILMSAPSSALTFHPVGSCHGRNGKGLSNQLEKEESLLKKKYFSG